nr:hypothetical protein [Tanacetum cinerariifolium]
METDEIRKQYIAPCFVNGLKAYDGEVNLEFDENLILNEFAIKLCLDYEVKKGKKLVKKELIVALKGELYFVKFIINSKEDDFKPGVILGRSFLRLAHGVFDFGNEVITIYLEPDPFEDDSEKTGKSSDDWDFDDVEKEALAITISQKFALLKEARHVIETIAYNDKYKKILNEIWRDKVELDGKIMKEEEEAVKRIKGETLKEKDDPGREEMKKIDRGITMINHTQAKAMGKLSDVLCQVGTLGIYDGEAGSSRSKRPRQHETVEEKIIKFRLGGRAHNLTLLEFARRLGLLQAVELEEDSFNVYFGGVLRNDDNFNAQDYWLTISQEDNLGLSRSHTSTIRNLILRVIHKMITYGLCQRTTGYDKVQKNDL